MPIATIDHTVAWQCVHGVWLTAWGACDATQDDWENLVLGAVLERPINDRALIWSAGGSPTHRQRKQLADITVDSKSADGYPMAVCTDSDSAWRSVEALVWMVDYDAERFSGNDVASAIAWLEVGDGLVLDIVSVLRDLRALVE